MRSMLLFLTLILIMTPTVALATGIDQGILDIKTNTIDIDEIETDLVLHITDISSNEVYSATVLKKYRFNGKIELPYGVYKITYIGLTPKEQEEYIIDYGEEFIISETEATVSLTISKKELTPVEEKGIALITANVPKDIKDNVLISISSKGKTYKVTLDANKKYSTRVKLPYGNYTIQDVSIINQDSNDYNIEYIGDFIISEDPVDVALDIATPKNDVAPEEPVEPEEPIDIEEPEKEDEKVDENKDEKNKRMSPIFTILIIILVMGAFTFGAYKVYSFING